MSHKHDHIQMAFLGHSCAAAASALGAILSVGARPASPGGPQGHSVAPKLWPSASGRPGEAVLAPTHELAYLHGIEIVAVILAGSPRKSPGEVERLAAAAGIPVVWITCTSEATAALRAVAPDVALAACFPWRLPRAARAVPPLGILNIHPSLLPIGRGPEPVFWTLRRGERTTGVTVHQMDAGFDTGPIVIQETAPVPEGVRATELEHALMARGGRLLREVLPAVVSGELQPVPQPSAGATSAPVPAPADWTIVTSLPAAWAWRFAHGVAPLGGPLAVIAGGRAIRVCDALAWSPDERLPEAIQDEGDGVIRVRFSPGWVRFHRAEAQT